MKNIPELLDRLPGIATVTIQCYSRNQSLFPLQQANNDIQMLFYWWSEASKELEQILGPPDIIHEGEGVRTILVPPTLMATTEQLNYIIDQLGSLAKDTQDYLDEAPLPASVRYKVERGYDKVMEAKFSTQTAVAHYGELTRAATTGNQLSGRQGSQL